MKNVVILSVGRAAEGTGTGTTRTRAASFHVGVSKTLLSMSQYHVFCSLAAARPIFAIYRL